MIVDKINQFLTSKRPIDVDDGILSEFTSQCGISFSRQFTEEDQEPSVRISNAGSCIRKLWYINQKTPIAGKKLDSRAKIVFFYGDQIEASVVALAKAAGVSIEHTGQDQLEVALHIEDRVILGHPDGVINGDTLFECKSMNDFAFKKFEKGDVDETYKAQIQLYMGLLKLKKCCFVSFNKQSGVMSELIINFNEMKFNSLKNNLQRAFQDEAPEAPQIYDVDEKGFYPWQCLYCPYHEVCRPNGKKVVMSNRYKLKHMEE